MSKTVMDCRAESTHIPRVVNGLEAWILRSEIFGTYGVQFYAPGKIAPGVSIQTEHDGVYTAVEKL